MKRYAYILFAVATILQACTEDPVHETSHPDQAKITLQTDWSKRTDGIAIPPEYTVQVNELEVTASATSYTLPNLFEPGDYRIRVFNTADGITLDKDIATVATTGAIVSATPGWWFTAGTLVSLERDKESNVSLAMQQQIRQLTIELTVTQGDMEDIESVTASLSGIANSMNIKDNTYSGSGLKVVPVFSRSADKLVANVRLIGLTSETHTLDLTINRSGNPGQQITQEVGYLLAGFEKDKYKPLTLKGNLELGQEVGFETTITGWKVQDTIDGNTEIQ